MKTTISRVREQGTTETVTANSIDRINAIQAVIDNSQYAKIDGTMIDLFTASAIMSIYNGINEANKVKFSSQSAGRMGQIAFKVINKTKS